MDTFSSHNLKTYSKAFVLRQFGRATGLHPPEVEILSQLRTTFKGKCILDIGVGGGRTTPFLTEISKDYVGIDYSPRMIERSKRRYPEVEFKVCDVRDLSQFRDGQFDLAFFSFNGLDYIGHQDRIRALAEIRRVLSVGGAFVFSSHNRASATKSAWSLRHLPYRINPFANPKTFFSKALSYPLGIYNSRKMKVLETSTKTYELRNDEAESYSLVTYYIFIDDQIHQLEEARFRDCQLINPDGKWLDLYDYRKIIDPWIYYLCWR